MKKKKVILCMLVVILIVVTGLCIIRNLQFEYREPAASEDSCLVYYLLNIDGMKGLGHSSFLLVDEQGAGTVYSYNGMQYNLLQCLAGKAGVGKMKQFSLSAQEVSDFLETGNLRVSDVTECDNFDRALYRYLSREEYETIVQGTERYIQAGNEYEALYAQVYSAGEDMMADAKARLSSFLKREEIPFYQIYRHNCDTVARELIGGVDEEVKEFNESKERLTPSGNYKRMCEYLGENWGCKALGEDSAAEKLLWILQ